MKNLAFCALLLLAQAVAFPQMVGGAFSGAATTGEFNRYVKNAAGLTADFTFYAPPQVTSMTFGFDVGYYVYDYSNQTSSFVTSRGSRFDAKETRTSSIATFHAILRAMGPDRAVRPYAEMCFGGAFLSTSTTISNYMTDEEISSNWDHSSWAWNAGAGAGLMIRVFQPDVKSSIGSIYLDLRARYLAGSRTDYLRKEDINLDSYGNVVYAPSRSKTDMMVFSLGVQVSIMQSASEE